ncbi:MAG: FCD domain-containing protein [Bacillota bacterium]|nr:FadR family transcriptional regulator [Candidatus Fermentithermobacillaceae bacterium]
MRKISSYQDDNAYLAALDVVAESDVPVGAWYLRRALSEKGIQVSEATCGRLLRMMEDAGHVEAMSRKGRVATPRGHRVLQEWRERQRRDRSQVAFVQSLKVHNPEELIDVLIARRALEGEAAALAAENASPEEIGRLRNIVKAHEEALAAGSSAAEENTDFHLTLAEASKNKVIVAAIEVIYRHPDVMTSLEYIRAHAGSKMAEDHNPIIRAVAERDVRAARNTMIQHLNNVIEDVKTYLRALASEGDSDSEGKREDSGRV